MQLMNYNVYIILFMMFILMCMFVNGQYIGLLPKEFDNNSISIVDKTTYKELDFKTDTVNVKTKLLRYDDIVLKDINTIAWYKFVDNKSKIKFGFNDTISKDNSKYLLKFNSNNTIKYDNKKKKYYIDERFSYSNQLSKVYSRIYLNLDDVCKPLCIGESYNGKEIICNQFFYPNCIYNRQTENILVIEFDGYYDSSKDMVFIDPTYTYNDVSVDNTWVKNVTSQTQYSHLNVSDPNILMYMSWQVSEGGVLSDLSDYEWDGTNVNLDWTASGKIGGAYVFDGDNDYVDFGDDSLGEDICDDEYCAFSAWAYAIEQRSQMIVGRWDATNDDRFIYFAVLSDGRITFQIWYTGAVAGGYDSCTNQTAGTFQLNQWNHMVGVYNSTHVFLYYNNNLACIMASTGNTNDVAWDDDENLYIGTRQDDGVRDFWNGTLDEVIMFDDGLTVAEIGQLYNSTYQKHFLLGNQTFPGVDMGTGYVKMNVSIEADVVNDSSLYGKLWESTDNISFTKSSSGELEFTTYNATHSRATYNTLATSRYYKFEPLYKSIYGTYSPYVFSINLVNYDGSAPGEPDVGLCDCDCLLEDCIKDGYCFVNCTTYNITTGCFLNGFPMIFQGPGNLTINGTLYDTSRITIRDGCRLNCYGNSTDTSCFNIWDI